MALPRDSVFQKAIGVISFGDYAVCTAFVSGHNEITTSAHCLPVDSNLSSYSFRTGSGERYAITSVERNPGVDVGRAKIDGSLSFILQTDEPNPAKEAVLISYSESIEALVRDDSGTLSLNPSTAVSHTFDSEGGASGAPILQEGKVIAIHVGSLNRQQRNVAVRAIPGAPTQGLEAFLDYSPEWNCNSNCKWYQPDCHAYKQLQCTKLGKITRCMGFPNQVEATACFAALGACAPTAGGGPVPYGVCIGAACGAAGAQHGYRCAQSAGIID